MLYREFTIMITYFTMWYRRNSWLLGVILVWNLWGRSVLLFLTKLHTVLKLPVFNNGMASQGSASTIVMRYDLRGDCGQQRGCLVLELFC